jgi:hypothetical protein
MLRRIGVVAGVVAVVLLLAGCIASPGRGDSRPLRLPLGLPISVVAGCEQSAGLGGSAPVTTIWRDQLGLHVRIGLGSQYAVGSGISNTEAALLSCLTVASGTREPYPVDSAGLLLLWKYSATVLWPCFAQHGVDIGPLPSRATFLEGDPLQIDPFNLIRSGVSDELWAQLHRDCPPVPSYLKTAVG